LRGIWPAIGGETTGDMRWFWIDRFVEFQSGRRAKAIKNVTLAEEHLHDHFPGYPVMPNSLVIEGMGQTAMFLACEAIGYSQLILLAKVASARFVDDAMPGDTLIYTATIHSIKAEGIAAEVVGQRNGKSFGAAELLFTRIDDPAIERPNANLLEMARWMRTLGVFTVGVTAEGAPLRPPDLLTRTEMP
jgi:3-hydroxyacyl-[acyl-carrier-protein] dehydratase